MKLLTNYTKETANLITMHGILLVENPLKILEEVGLDQYKILNN